ncbi:protein of unknown function DUF29 [Paraburkholderia phenazinium]|uniref:DUF29 domain-containing protein n=1 Tax=Paraburkholderia phenazinium TaxID=60549 RepID=A0A1G8I1E4_9BURK|nr:DUF29 domain-containing protein [Paraburkholderia phenazinium]SDI12632.1 protein of unknown function DUF29 [Paraburkholderia phenazinium]SDI59953.1 protein of unknown function DUF29 [Paraburkholderia phenazinium]
MTTYDEDVCAWAFEQARFLRERRFDLLDIEHLADEIEDIAKAELVELARQMSVLFALLLKWNHLPAERTDSRSAMIEARRLDVADILDDSPSLRAKVDEPRTFQLIWADALAQATAESGHDWFPSECPWAIDDVLSEGWLPADASKLRHVDLRALALNIDATYIRVSGKSGARIRYQRINFGRPTQGRKAKAGAIVSRMALTICMLAPDVVDTILTMPSGPLGRLVKAKVRRARTPKHTRGLVKRRPASTIFCIRDSQR